MPYSTLLLDVRDHVAHLTLNRPEAYNTISDELTREFMLAALECDQNPDVRAVLLTGAGKAFSAGGDLRGFAAHSDTLPAHIKELTTYLHAAISFLTRMRAPVIAAVNGIAAGAGMSLACAADIAIAAESARFTMAYTAAGLSPDGSSTFFLPRIVGLRRALDLTLTNRMLTAHEALEWGIVSRVVPDVELSAEAEALAARLASGPTRALGAAKRLLRESGNQTLETQMLLESEFIAEMTRTSDAWEGIRAFLEKRLPSFKGE
jgi:2-(1,2-epoxy-1,2-dihydrophenyl)acetyl-CoA isomerase